MQSNQTTLNYIIESNGDDTICSPNLELATKYAQNIFSLLADENPIQIFTSLPETLPPQNYFILKSKDGSLSLNESITLKLFKIETVEVGWIRSIKIRTTKLVKEIHIKAVDLINHTTRFCSGCGYDCYYCNDNTCEVCGKNGDCNCADMDDGLNEKERDEFFKSITIKDISKDKTQSTLTTSPTTSSCVLPSTEKTHVNCECDHCECDCDKCMDMDMDDGLNEKERDEFFRSITIKDISKEKVKDEIYNEDKKKEMICFVQGKLVEVEMSDSRKKRMEIVIQIFEKLATLTGKAFIQHHARFSDTIKKKMVELLYKENFEEMKDFYVRIFDTEIPNKL